MKIRKFKEDHLTEINNFYIPNIRVIDGVEYLCINNSSTNSIATTDLSTGELVGTYDFRGHPIAAKIQHIIKECILNGSIENYLGEDEYEESMVSLYTYHEGTIVEGYSENSTMTSLLLNGEMVGYKSWFTDKVECILQAIKDESRNCDLYTSMIKELNSTIDNYWEKKSDNEKYLKSLYRLIYRSE